MLLVVLQKGVLQVFLVLFGLFVFGTFRLFSICGLRLVRLAVFLLTSVTLLCLVSRLGGFVRLAHWIRFFSRAWLFSWIWLTPFLLLIGVLGGSCILWRKASLRGVLASRHMGSEVPELVGTLVWVALLADEILGDLEQHLLVGVQLLRSLLQPPESLVDSLHSRAHGHTLVPVLEQLVVDLDLLFIQVQRAGDDLHLVLILHLQDIDGLSRLLQNFQNRRIKGPDAQVIPDHDQRLQQDFVLKVELEPIVTHLDVLLLVHLPLVEEPLNLRGQNLVHRLLQRDLVLELADLLVLLLQRLLEVLDLDRLVSGIILQAVHLLLDVFEQVAAVDLFLLYDLLLYQAELDDILPLLEAVAHEQLLDVAAEVFRFRRVCADVLEDQLDLLAVLGLIFLVALLDFRADDFLKFLLYLVDFLKLLLGALRDLAFVLFNIFVVLVDDDFGLFDELHDLLLQGLLEPNKLSAPCSADSQELVDFLVVDPVLQLRVLENIEKILVPELALEQVPDFVLVLLLHRQILDEGLGRVRGQQVLNHLVLVLDFLGQVLDLVRE